MIAEIIGVGAELCHSGQGGSEARFLAQELKKLGISLHNQMAAASDRDRLRRAVGQALRRSDIVITLGGLGEGPDAFAKETICEGLGLPLERHQPTAHLLEELFAQAGKELPHGVAQNAMQPQGATIFLNHLGLCPGCAVSAGQQCILMLPGEPRELEAMFRESVAPYLRRFAGGAEEPAEEGGNTPSPARSARSAHVVRVMGLSRSEAADALRNLFHDGSASASVSTHGGELAVTVTGYGADSASAAKAASAAVQLVRQRLGKSAYGVDVENIQQALVASLRRHGLRIAVAEGGTGGTLCGLLSPVPGSDRAVAYGMSATSARSKEEKLGVPRKLLSRFGGVSEPAAAAMADGVRQAGGAQLGLAVTAPVAGSEEENELYIALSNGSSVWVKRLTADGGDRERFMAAAADQAFNMARLYLDCQPGEMPGGEDLAAVLSGASAKHKSKKSKTASGGHSQEAGQLSKEKSKKKSGFLSRIIPQKGDSKGDLVRKSIFWIAVAVFIGAMVYIGSVFMESSNNKKLNSNLSDLFHGLSDGEDVDVEGYPDDYLAKFKALWAQNEDIKGWITLEGTQVDYPVVQADDNAYYERRDFTRASNQHGIPFIDFRVDVKKPSTNTVIYAHNMNDGQMFGELMNYKSLAYYQQHPTVDFDSVYREGTYKIFGIVLCKKDDPEFLYHSFINPDSEAETTEFLQKVQARSLLTLPVDVLPTDELLTLSTCDYTFKSAEGDRIARFVVFARKMREGEDAAVDVSKAHFNPNPVLPQEWYDQIKRNQEAERKAQEEAMAKLKAEAANWFTSSELASIADADLSSKLEERKAEFTKYVSLEELEKMTAEEKINAYNQALSGTDYNEELYLQADQYLSDRGDMDWLSGSARENFILQMIQQPESKWDALCQQLLNQSGGLSISAEGSTTMNVGQKQTLYLQMQGDTGESINWSSSRSAVVEITEDYGTEAAITAKKDGTATITAKMGSKSASIDITVKEGAVSIQLSVSKLAMGVGESAGVSASVSPDGDYIFDWRTNGNSSAMEIDDSTSSSIQVTAKKKGSYTLTLRVKNSDGKVVGSADLPVEIGAGQQKMEASIAAGSTSLKKGDTTTIWVEGAPRGAKFSWSASGAVKRNGSSSSSEFSVEATKTGSGTVEVTITAEGYADTTLRVTIKVTDSSSSGGGSSTKPDSSSEPSPEPPTEPSPEPPTEPSPEPPTEPSPEPPTEPSPEPPTEPSPEENGGTGSEEPPSGELSPVENGLTLQ